MATWQALKKIRNAYKVLVRMYDGKRTLKRKGHRWEKGMEVVEWTHVTQDMDH
jgi:hypothetical protein